MSDAKDIFTLVPGGLSKDDQALIEKAYQFSQKAHAEQKRMNGEPYFIHVVETAKNLARMGMDARTMAAGLLHDVLEDTEVTETELEHEFGQEIVMLVKGVTKLGTLKYRGDERHVESLRKFFVAMAADLRVVMIKFADRLHNLQTLSALRDDKRKRIALESIDVYAPLANRLGMGKLRGELEDAAFPYAYPEEYAKVEEIIRTRKEEYEKNLEEIRRTLAQELQKNKIKPAEMNYRVKHKYSLYKKLVKYDMDIEKVYDIVALRVVVDSIEECYRVLGIIHSIWKPLPGRIKDYIAIPKMNGYRSIHTTIFVSAGKIAEIQIRTREMHAEAAYGVAAHFAYKEGKSEKIKADKSKMTWIEELKNFNAAHGEQGQDTHTSFLENLKMDFFSDRIFIFTPKGDVIDLPTDSTPIDFAYAVHSDIGEHISGAKINGKMSQIFSALKNGDIVEIITKKNAAPSSKWLDHTKTTGAKRHIRNYLEKNSLLSRLKSFGK